MTRVVIVMDRGLIQDAFSNGDLELLVCDYDMESGMGKDLVETPHGESGYHRIFPCSKDPGLVDAWFLRWLNRDLAKEDCEAVEEEGESL